jgi:class 3 adenylate cyclase
MPNLPTGTVTFLFTDIEGSTNLLETLGRATYSDLLAAHDRVLRETWSEHGGVEVDTEGDSFFVAFEHPSSAVAAAADAQRKLSSAQAFSPEVRMGVHTGEAALVGDKYVGLAVHRAARIAAAAHGGQVLVSQATADLLVDAGLDGLGLRELGLHRLKDLSHPERLYQLSGVGLRADFPAPRTLENRPMNLPVQPTPLVGRDVELRELGSLLDREGVRLVTPAAWGRRALRSGSRRRS